jgi:hypothetical protein
MVFVIKCERNIRICEALLAFPTLKTNVQIRIVLLI